MTHKLWRIEILNKSTSWNPDAWFLNSTPVSLDYKIQKPFYDQTSWCSLTQVVAPDSPWNQKWLQNLVFTTKLEWRATNTVPDQFQNFCPESRVWTIWTKFCRPMFQTFLKFEVFYLRVNNFPFALHNIRHFISLWKTMYVQTRKVIIYGWVSYK